MRHDGAWRQERDKQVLLLEAPPQACCVVGKGRNALAASLVHCVDHLSYQKKSVDSSAEKVGGAVGMWKMGKSG